MPDPEEWQDWYAVVVGKIPDPEEWQDRYAVVVGKRPDHEEMSKSRRVATSKCGRPWLDLGYRYILRIKQGAKFNDFAPVFI